MTTCYSTLWYQLCVLLLKWWGDCWNANNNMTTVAQKRIVWQSFGFLWLFSDYDAEYLTGDYLSNLARYKFNYILTDIATNWANEVDAEAQFYIYKFFPHKSSTYNYVAECSNRGICNNFEGECECFACDKKAPRCDHMGSDWQTLTRDAIRGAARLSERRFVCYRLDLSTRGFTGPLCCLSVRPAVILTY